VLEDESSWFEGRINFLGNGGLPVSLWSLLLRFNINLDATPSACAISWERTWIIMITTKVIEDLEFMVFMQFNRISDGSLKNHFCH